ncbi:GreA/GreB family elongation factor [Luteolibacter sp. AS25]|uniref:GreA/GreB family elongation factor n=1 Tax=Luteolibacter sp. AS25 TaxID=3135776 RepID=UPI00398ABBC3
MNSSINLKEADELRLKMLLNREMPPPFPDVAVKQAIEGLMRAAKPVSGIIAGDTRAGFYDTVTLVSPNDSKDFFKFSMVMPHEANVDKDLISIFMPVSLAVLGRKCGETVAWETRAGERSMQIISLEEVADNNSGFPGASNEMEGSM